jgi:GT2 family glycosyltransferase
MENIRTIASVAHEGHGIQGNRPMTDSMFESNQARVAIVMVNWNGWRECVECIDSLLRQSHQNFHLFVVDNDSQDKSIEKIRAWCAAPQAEPGWRRQSGVDRHTDRSPCEPVADRVTVIPSGANRGFAGGCNVGIAAAGLSEFEYFWFLNPDTVVGRRALTELLVRAAQGEPDMGIVGSTLLFYDAPETIHALAGGRLNRLNASSAHIAEGSTAAVVPEDGSWVEDELDFVCGASMLVATSFIRRVGPMQEDYFLYYEEADWAMRGAREGFRLGYAPESRVFHKSGANSSKLMPLFTARYYYRNRLRFVNRFFPDRMAAAKRKLLEEMLRHIVRGRWGLARVVGSTLLSSPKA